MMVAHHLSAQQERYNCHNSKDEVDTAEHGRDDTSTTSLGGAVTLETALPRALSEDVLLAR